MSAFMRLPRTKRRRAFVKIEAWIGEKLSWFRRCLEFEHDLPSHDTLKRLSVRICPREFARHAVQRRLRRLADHGGRHRQREGDEIFAVQIVARKWRGKARRKEIFCLPIASIIWVVFTL
jgi:hypothetical protein